jgi:hypothetical protein
METTENLDTIYWASYAVFGAMFASGAALYWYVTRTLRGTNVASDK